MSRSLRWNLQIMAGISALLLCLAVGTSCYRSASAVGDSGGGAGGIPDGEWDGGEYDGAKKLVCVFDIDSTLTCSHSYEAVSACKDVGALLAVNTAEGKATALSNKAGAGYVDWGELGFPTDGKALDLEWGTFMFGRCSPDCSCSEEFGGQPGDCEKCSDCGPDCPASFMGKAYGMSRIADYYGIENDKCLVLLDDLLSNTSKVELFGYSAYFHGTCASGWNGTGVYEEVRAFLEGSAFAECGE